MAEESVATKRQGNSSRPLRAKEIAARAAQHLADLADNEPERVSALERDDDGWRVTLEVVELRRVPNTMDILGVYEVTLSERGSLRGYRRIGRHERGRIESSP